MQTNSNDEIFDVVDTRDNVIARLPRAEVHAKKLLHRAVHAIFFNARGDLLLQKRSMLKDRFPGIYTTSCSGHVDSGEDYETALVRECSEELGVRTKISDYKYIGKISPCEETDCEFVKIYTITHEGPFSFPPDEVQSLEWMPRDVFETEIKRAPELFTPSFLKVYEFYKNV